MEFKNIFYPNEFPVLITQSEHNRIIEILDSNSRDRKNMYLYKDLVFCKKCGRKLACTCGTSRTGKKYLYYKCEECRKSLSDDLLRELFRPFLYKIVESAPVTFSEAVRELNVALDES